MAEAQPVVGILSIGEMGLGIANLLLSHGYRVVTYAEDRRQVFPFRYQDKKNHVPNRNPRISKATKDRARSTNIELLPSIKDLICASAVILSIVPPKDALRTAQRVHDQTPSNIRDKPVYYLDLNATAPSLATHTNDLLSSNPNKSIVYVDGGIIGGPPRKVNSTGWTTPSLVVSGPTQLPYPDLARTLNIEHVSPRIGAASGVKLCFASTTKGFFALAIQSYVTAQSMGVFPELRKYMGKHNPQTLEIADRGVVGMPPKAYRWVNEMQQIGEMMEREGGFGKGL